MIEPTERSMPPVVMTKVIATATINVGAAWRSRLSRLPVEMNTSLSEVNSTQQAMRNAAMESTWACVCRKSLSLEPCPLSL